MSPIEAANKAIKTTLEYEFAGIMYYILAVPVSEKSDSGKFNIRKEGVIRKDVWIKTDSIMDSLMRIGAQLPVEERTPGMKALFLEYAEKLGVIRIDPVSPDVVRLIYI